MKQKRQDKMIELIERRTIETQEELAKLLKQQDFDVTQATVSRDIRELKLTKMPSQDGRQKYVVTNIKEDHMNDKYIRVLRDGYLSTSGYSTKYSCH